MILFKRFLAVLVALAALFSCMPHGKAQAFGGIARPSKNLNPDFGSGPIGLMVSIQTTMPDPKSEQVAIDPEKLLAELRGDFAGMGLHPCIIILGNAEFSGLYDMNLEEKLKSHNVKHFVSIMAFVSPYNTKGGFSWVLTITPWVDKAHLPDKPIDCFYTMDESYDALLKSLGEKMKKAGVTVSKFCDKQEPEIITQANLLSGDMIEGLPADWKSKELLFLSQPEIRIPAKSGADPMLEAQYKKLEHANEKARDYNAKCKKILDGSGISYKMVTPEQSKAVDTASHPYMVVHHQTFDKAYRFAPSKYAGTPPPRFSSMYTGDVNKMPERTVVNYWYFYILDRRTGDYYYVDYGDQSDLDISLRRFLAEITKQ